MASPEPPSHVHSRPFDPEGDLPLLLDLVVAATGDPARPCNWQVGDVLWQMYLGHAFDPAANIRLWEDRDGHLCSFAWREGHASVVLQLHPRSYADATLEEAMLGWVAAEWSEPGDGGARALTTYARECDHERIDLLTRSGFVRGEGYLLQEMRCNLDLPIAAAPLPPGAVIRHITDARELPERVALHREVWTGSKMTLESYREMRGVAGYRPELDIVAVLPDGAFASYCICWLDPINRMGEFEPVGTRAAYRQRGIGKAVICEGLRRLRAHGARTALVNSMGGNAASRALYESAGFRIVDREYAYILNDCSAFLR